MNIIRLAVSALIFAGTSLLLTSCGKTEKTPAEEIEQTTSALETKAATLEKEAKEKEAEAAKAESVKRITPPATD